MTEITERRLKRYEAAEETCRALRAFHSQRVVDQTSEQVGIVMKALLRWMRLTGGKVQYALPKGWPEGEQLG
jgi:hypothetical protein